MKKYLARVKALPRNTLYALGAVVAVILAVLFFSGGEEKYQTMTVVPGEFVQEVSVSGKVVAARDVDLSFPETGRVDSVQVEVGDVVVAGKTLATLAMGTLLSDLQSAEASLDLRLAESRNSAVSLEEVREEQDAFVASAYRTLLSDDLAAVPVSSGQTAQPPTISGLYQGAEGVYRVRIERDPSGTGYQLFTSNLDRSGPVDIEEDEPTKLGTRGLFISFSGSLSTYTNSAWTITIPNQKSDSYLANYNAYQEALRARDRAVADAEADLREGGGSAVAQAQIEQARAEVSRIRAEISERIIRAPFGGTVTAVDVKLGSISSANTPALSLMSTDVLQIESFVPEINLSFVKAGAPAIVTLDAYGTAVPFEAAVVSIDPAETVRDGVSTYRAILQFTNQDERIRPGMTANVRITADRRDHVISIPRGAVEERDGQKYVRVLSVNEEVEERAVTTGNVSSLGSLEILQGLREGEVVILSD